jgi:magnesium chelatase family protein
MLAKVRSCTIIGLEGKLIEVEVDLSDESAAFTIVGLSDVAFNESREDRVRSAIKNSGYLYPLKRITVSISPPNLPKKDFAYDLPITIGVLLASGQINPTKYLDESLFFGVLSPDGCLCHTNGILPMVALASEELMTTVFAPAANAMEASLVQGVTVYPVETLAQLIAHLNNQQQIEPFVPDQDMLDNESQTCYEHDFAAVLGQDHVKRALEVAASGGHSVLMSGPDESGKRSLARSLPSILPRLTVEATLEITKIYSVSGKLHPHKPLIRQRPFRAPHHTITLAGLVGEGDTARPGEFSLAHHGILFLDELPAFSEHMLGALHQPLKEKATTIYRAQDTITYPANVLLVASMKPCPCGNFADPVRECICSAKTIARYLKRVRDPLLDRIDVYVEVPRVDYERLTSRRQVENSETIRKRVQAARERQLERFRGTKLMCNAEMGPQEVREFCLADAASEKLLKAATQQLHLPAQANYQVRKLARTIADLAGTETILANHIAEAIQYRLRTGA